MVERTGLLEVYYGDGKGKTTAALGLALRFAGQGYRVLVVQFFKNRFSGELAALQSIPGILVRQFGSGQFILPPELGEADRKEFAAGWNLVCRQLSSDHYDLIILDELTYAFQFGLLEWETCADVLRKRSPTCEVVITGRKAPEPLVELADLVTEMKMVKHPAERGVAARPGIEF